MSLTHVKGLDELQKFLDQLPAKMEKNIMRGALRAGANVVKDEAKKNLTQNQSVVTGLIRDGIKVSTRYRRGKVTAAIKATGDHDYIAHWLEYGVAAHSLRKKAKLKSGKYQGTGTLHPGFKEKPFMRPALDGRASAALVAVGEHIKKRLTKQGIDTADVEIEAL